MPPPITPRSIRFRLTAWYTLLLTMVLFVLGFSLAALFERQLRADVDERLLAAASEIYGDVRVQSAFPTSLPHIALPELDPYGSPGVLIQVVGVDGRILQSSGSLGSRRLPAAPVSEGDRGAVYTTTQVNGTDVRTVRLAMVTQDGQTIGSINVGESLMPIERALRSLSRLLIVASVAGIGLAALGGWLLAGRALRPVDDVTATAAKIAAGDGSATSLATRLRVPATDDEVARLAATFNAMLDRIEATFATQRRFVADASHELRTPLTAIRGNIDVITRQAARGEHALDSDIVDALDDIGRESGRMSRLVDGLLLLARSDAPDAHAAPTQPLQLDQIARDTVRAASAMANGQRLKLATDGPAIVAGDPDRLSQLILILLDNALRHTPADGEITVRVAATSDQTAQLTVIDTGEGIAAEHLPRIFERFYRADTARSRSGGGTGLGLAIARAIAQDHGGEVAATSVPGHGASFTVTLPAVRKSA